MNVSLASGDESLELSDLAFDREYNEALVHQVVTAFLAGGRSGSRAQKIRAEVRGGGRKPWRQKGTGRARAGSNRSPLWRGGGTVHGPQPRSYGYHLPRKMLVGALRSALSVKLADGALKVVKNFDLAAPKTKEFSGVLDRLGVEATVLLVNNGENDKLMLSSRNIPGVTLLESRDVHPYHLLRCKTVIFSEAAVQHCSEVLK